MTQVSLLRRTLIAAFASGAAVAAHAAPSPDHPAVQRALAHLNGQAIAAARVAADDSFEARSLTVDADGAEHVRFARRHKGLHVIGGDFVVHSSADGSFNDVSIAQAEAIALDLAPQMQPSSAAAAALASFRHMDGQVSAKSLVIYARNARPQLAWDVLLKGVQADGTPSETHMLIGAGGKLLDSWDDIHTERPEPPHYGVGKTLYSGDVTVVDVLVGGWQLIDNTRGRHRTLDMKHTTTSEGENFDGTDSVWGNNKLTNNETVGADAHYGHGVAWDYYKNVLKRNGLDNDGRGTYSRVHYSNNYSNAFWSESCMCMTYGDGSNNSYPRTGLDVVGHEYTHGITFMTADLTYSGESGGLNEGTSDIFGEMIEFYANNAKDPGDYLHGETYRSGGSRNMINPSSDGASSDCWYSGVGRLDVHYSSGVANHFFYLLAEGTRNGSPSKTCVAGNTRVATGNGTVTGIGRTKAAKIWYRALDVYMTSSETYAAARTHTIRAADDLYGAGSVESRAVAAAWTAVNRP